MLTQPLQRLDPYDWLDLDTAVEPRVDIPSLEFMKARHQSLAEMYERDLNKLGAGMDPLGQGVRRELAKCLMLVHQGVVRDLEAMLR